MEWLNNLTVEQFANHVLDFVKHQWFGTAVVVLAVVGWLRGKAGRATVGNVVRFATNLVNQMRTEPEAWTLRDDSVWEHKGTHVKIQEQPGKLWGLMGQKVVILWPKCKALSRADQKAVKAELDALLIKKMEGTTTKAEAYDRQRYAQMMDQLKNNGGEFPTQTSPTVNPNQPFGPALIGRTSKA